MDVIEKSLKKIGNRFQTSFSSYLCYLQCDSDSVWRVLAIAVGIFLIIHGMLVLIDYMDVKKQQEASPAVNQKSTNPNSLSVEQIVHCKA